jgi:hypothetical protein
MALSVQLLALAPGGSGLLDEWATVVGVRAGRLVWRLEPDRFCANLDAHRDPSILLSWLSALDKHDSPRSAGHVAAVFERWRGSYGATRLFQDVLVVEARDEPTLREALAAVPDLAAQMRIVAPGVAMLPRHHVDRLRVALSTRGYLV